MTTIRTNIAAAIWEIVILGSVVLVVWLAAHDHRGGTHVTAEIAEVKYLEVRTRRT